MVDRFPWRLSVQFIWLSSQFSWPTLYFFIIFFFVEKNRPYSCKTISHFIKFRFYFLVKNMGHKWDFLPEVLCVFYIKQKTVCKCFVCWLHDFSVVLVHRGISCSLAKLQGHKRKIFQQVNNEHDIDFKLLKNFFGSSTNLPFSNLHLNPFFLNKSEHKKSDYTFFILTQMGK